MKITTSPFHFEHHYSKSAGNSILGYYVYHCATAYNSIFIDGVEYTACYQTGDINYLYDCPSNKLKLTDYSTSELLTLIQNWAINSLYKTELYDELQDIQEIQKLCPKLDNIDKMTQVWEVLRDNQPQLKDYIDFDVYTDNINDYEEDGIGHLTLKQ